MMAISRKPTTTAMMATVRPVADRLRPEEWGTGPEEEEDEDEVGWDMVDS